MSTKLKAGTATSGAVIDADTTGILELQSGSTPTTAVTIDASQNVGIGITPSAWNTTFRPMQFIGGGVIASQIGGSYKQGFNWYFDGDYKYISTNTACRYDMDDAHRWYTASSGSASSAITWSERMRINSSGDLLVGTTSANGRLSVTGVDSTGSNFALNTRNSGNNQLLAIRNDGYANFGTQATAPYNFGVSSATKAMYMDSSGGLGYNSSIRASKTNITPSPSVNWLKDLDIVTFNYRKRDELGNYTEEAENELRWGVIAEDAEKVAKDFCSYDSNGVLDGFNYDRLIPVLVKAIQELNAKVEALEAQLGAK